MTESVAVVDGVGDVGGLGAGGAWVLDHGFEHLRGSDDGLAVLGCAADDVLLDGGNFFWREFDAEIAARDHDGVSDFEDACRGARWPGAFSSLAMTQRRT